MHQEALDIGPVERPVPDLPDDPLAGPVAGRHYAFHLCQSILLDRIAAALQRHISSAKT